MAGIGEVGERLRRSTVQVRAGRNSGGSGVIWDSLGSIITNAHVARGSAGFEIQLWDGRDLTARLVKRDARRDLALLQIDAPAIQAATVGDSSRLRVGELVIAVGNPLGFTGALSTGVVHGLGPVRGLGGDDYVHATVRLAPGNSGGPLATATGNVIGINTMVVRGGLGLAVPSNHVIHFISAQPPVELGVTVRPVRIPASSSGIGWIVLEVEDGSPADRASLQVGDLITGANGRDFQGVGDLAQTLQAGSGGRLVMRFRRGSQTKQREVTVQLTEGIAA